MKILIQTLGSAGDTHPFIGVGSTLRERGHDVVVFANEIFEETVVGAGLRFVQMGDADTYQELAGRPDVWDRRRGIELILRGVAEHLRESIDIIESELDGADVLVNGSLGLGARLVRDIHGTPLVTMQLAPSLFRSIRRLPRTEIMWVRDSFPTWTKRLWWRVGDYLVDRIVAPELNEIRGEHRLEPVTRVLQEWAVYSPDATLGMFPEWFGPPQPDWAGPVQLVGFPLYDDGEQHDLDPDLAAWLISGAPPLVFTAGSANLHAEDFFQTAVDVCESLDVRGVLATANDSDVPDRLPDGVKHVGYAPFSKLFAHARGLVSHGGVGTTAQAFAAGLPHLIAHVNFDQRDNASRVEDVGAGLGMPIRRFSGEAAVEAVQRILRPEVASRAQELATTLDGQRSRRLAAETIEAAAVV